MLDLGRMHGALSDDLLRRFWIDASKVWVDHPTDDVQAALVHTLGLEAHLRNLDLPYGEVKEHFGRVMAAARLRIGDPAHRQAIGDQLVRDLLEYRAQRDKKRH